MKSSAYEPGLTKVKVKIPILGRLADLSLVKNKHEANGALILQSCIHQCSFYGVDVIPANRSRNFPILPAQKTRDNGPC